MMGGGEAVFSGSGRRWWMRDCRLFRPDMDGSLPPTMNVELELAYASPTGSYIISVFKKKP